MRKCHVSLTSTTHSLISLCKSYCKSDLVLASVGRLHEVLGGGNVADISGLAPTSEDVTALGVENVDIGGIIEGMCILCLTHSIRTKASNRSTGHFDLAAGMPDILRLIDVGK